MCGGFIVAYSSAKIDDKSNKFNQLFSHLLYNFGRVTSYILLGVVFGLIGTIFSISVITKGILYNCLIIRAITPARVKICTWLRSGLFLFSNKMLHAFL